MVSADNIPIIPLKAFRWFPKNRILVGSWNDINKHINAMSPLIIIQGKYRSLEFEADYDNKKFEGTGYIYHATGRKQGKIDLLDIELWYFLANSTPVYPHEE